MNDTVRAQILAIRDTGLTNMFATNTVQRIAFEMGYYELVEYLQDNMDEYVRFIFTGKTSKEEK